MHWMCLSGCQEKPNNWWIERIFQGIKKNLTNDALDVSFRISIISCYADTCHLHLVIRLVRFSSFFPHSPFPVNLNILAPDPEEGAFEYVLTVERYNPDTQSPEQYRQVAGLQISDFPYTLQNVPVGYYRTVINAVTRTGLRAVNSSLIRAGIPGKHTSTEYSYLPHTLCHSPVGQLMFISSWSLTPNRIDIHHRRQPCVRKTGS